MKAQLGSGKINLSLHIPYLNMRILIFVLPTKISNVSTLKQVVKFAS